MLLQRDGKNKNRVRTPITPVRRGVLSEQVVLINL